MREDDIVRDEASGYLGRELTDEEWNDAYPDAKRKLDWIISREGDADGERLKPYYLGKLVQEIVTQNAFSTYCRAMSEAMLA
ncbi:MAG: hypothetical protein LUD43_01905 [Firmicutes bacterium]|nr:hypothetical protein [Bacillota bacterium]